MVRLVLSPTLACRYTAEIPKEKCSGGVKNLD